VPYPGPAPHGVPAYPPPPRPHGLALAPLGDRIVARLIDICLVFLLNVAVNGIFVWWFLQETASSSQEFARRWLAGESTEGVLQASERAQNLQVAILLIAVALWFAYEVPATANTGQTIGKRIMGIKVVSLAETPQLTFGRSFRRWNLLGLGVFLWSCLGIGFFLQLVSCAVALFDRPLRQALHDKSAQTVVVQAPRTATAPPSGAGTGSHTPGGSR
jgi:uncharacterized RDD family membrane protein YckC